MLIHGSDREMIFDMAVQQAFPYIIFPPIRDSYEGLNYDEFRNKLIKNLLALYHFKNGNDSPTFYNQEKEILRMLESAVFDKSTTADIENYKRQQNTTSDAIREIINKQTEIEYRLNKLEKLSKKRKGSSKSDVKRSEGDNLSLKSEGDNLPSKGVAKKDKRKSGESIKDIVRNGLKSSTIPLTRMEICNKTGLNENQVDSGLYRLKQQIKCVEGDTQKTYMIFCE